MLDRLEDTINGKGGMEKEGERSERSDRSSERRSNYSRGIGSYTESVMTCSEDRLSNREIGKIKRWVSEKEKEKRRCNIVIKGMKLPKDLKRDIREGEK